MAKPSLAAAPDETHAARSALAEAIAVADRVRARRDVIDAAIARAEGIVSAALAKHEEAQAGVTLTKDAHASRVAEAATSGEVMLADPSLRDARIAEAEALDELDAARRALDKLRNENAATLRGFETVDDLTVALRNVDERVDDVFRATSLDKFIVETAAMQRDLINRRLILCGLLREQLVGTRETDTLNQMMGDFQLPQYFWPNGPGYSFRTQDQESIAACRQWREVREAMKRDAFAALPW